MTTSRLCTPKYATRRRPERPTYGGELAASAKALGQPMMPWQRMVADVAGEYNQDTGIPYYREVIVTVPRQSGKTTLFLSFQVHRCTAPRWPHPQRSAFTAQTGKDARDKWLDELFPLLRQSKLKRHIARIYEGMGNEYVKFRNGSIIRVLSSSNSSGHSKTLHQATLDELWHDQDARREQGLRPAMLTIDDAQLLVCSTQGTELSTQLNAKVKAGRAAALEDSGSGVAYFEYSAPDDWDPFDDESYYQFHPAICPNPPCRCGDGEWRHTITIDTLRAERLGMAENLPEFKRAYGNIPTAAREKREIPADVFDRVCHPRAAPDGQLRLGIDAPDDRSTGAIVAVGDGVVEVLEHRVGVGWMVERAAEIAERWDATVALDGGGPIAYMGSDLENRGVTVESLGASDVAEACGRIYDDIADEKILFAARGDHWQAMQDAVAGLASKPTGDRKVWSRSLSSADVSPFMAATVAWRPGKETEPFVIVT